MDTEATADATNGLSAKQIEAAWDGPCFDEDPRLRGDPINPGRTWMIDPGTLCTFEPSGPPSTGVPELHAIKFSRTVTPLSSHCRYSSAGCRIYFYTSQLGAMGTVTCVESWFRQ